MLNNKHGIYAVFNDASIRISPNSEYSGLGRLKFPIVKLYTSMYLLVLLSHPDNRSSGFLKQLNTWSAPLLHHVTLHSDKPPLPHL